MFPTDSRFFPWLAMVPALQPDGCNAVALDVGVVNYPPVPCGVFQDNGGLLKVSLPRGHGCGTVDAVSLEPLVVGCGVWTPTRFPPGGPTPRFCFVLVNGTRVYLCSNLGVVVWC